MTMKSTNPQGMAAEFRGCMPQCKEIRPWPGSGRADLAAETAAALMAWLLRTHEHSKSLYENNKAKIERLKNNLFEGCNLCTLPALSDQTLT